LGVEMVDSIDALLTKVDVVMLLSIDGRRHLEEARPVFAAGKRVFIDKPLGGSLVEAIKIIDLAQAYHVPCFSSSALRYGKELVEIRNSQNIGDIRGCDTYSPAPFEPHHPDFYWYGIHGVEPLFAILGMGCQSVTRVHTDGTDVIVGIWEGGRIGSVRGLRDAARGYGATVFGSKGMATTSKFGGYEPLIVEIVKFFKTGKPPVSAQETLEIMAFMEAADESKRQGGVPVTIPSVVAKATAAAARKG
jgi:predicted dehydrogenase